VEVVVVDQVQEPDRFVERVAGLDVGKIELKVCADTRGRGGLSQAGGADLLDADPVDLGVGGLAAH